MKQILIFLLLLCAVCIPSMAQEESKPILGVAETKLGTGAKGERFMPIFTKMIGEAAKASGRFRVVDRSDYDAIIRELEHQKREEYIDAEGVVDKDSRVGVPQLVCSTVVKMPFERIKNFDGTVRGYRASVNISIGIQNVESSVNYATKTFTAKPDKEYVSTEAAVEACANIISDQVASYFRTVQLKE